MPYSYNGWSASPSLAIRPLVVAGESFIPGVRDHDDVYAVLKYVAEQMHARVEPIVRSDWHKADDWGFNYRATTNDTSLSCHASGTAIDYNATRHPFGVPASANFTPIQIAEVRKILAELDGAVVWGGDYRGTPDAMHFEIATNAAHLATVAARINEPEDPMADYEAQLKRIEQQNDTILKRLEVDAAIRTRLTALVKQGRADSKELSELREMVEKQAKGRG